MSPGCKPLLVLQRTLPDRREQAGHFCRLGQEGIRATVQYGLAASFIRHLRHHHDSHPGKFCFSVRMTSKPPKRGRSRSMRITWGFDRSHELTASSPSAASATTFTPASLSNSFLMNFRYPWSPSAIRSLTASRLPGIDQSTAAPSYGAHSNECQRSEEHTSE